MCDAKCWHISSHHGITTINGLDTLNILVSVCRRVRNFLCQYTPEGGASKINLQ